MSDYEVTDRSDDKWWGHWETRVYNNEDPAKIRVTWIRVYRPHMRPFAYPLFVFWHQVTRPYRAYERRVGRYTLIYISRRANELASDYRTNQGKDNDRHA